MLRGELNTNYCLVLDFLHSLSELERLDRLFQVAVSPTSRTDQGGLCVTAETLLEQLGESGLSERNIATFTERLDDTTKNSEGEIDLFGLFKHLTCGTSLSDTL